MKKSILSKLCLIATVLCLILSFVACDNTSESSSVKESASTSVSESEAQSESSVSVSESEVQSESSVSVSESEAQSESSAASALVKILDNIVIITVDSSYMQITEQTVLVDYMTKLKEDGAIDFALKDGMVSSINGQENPADWSKCWMLYSDDAELTNDAWGSVTVGEKTYFSAILGAESLPIKDGKTYVWEFKSY